MPRFLENNQILNYTTRVIIIKLKICVMLNTSFFECTDFNTLTHLSSFCFLVEQEMVLVCNPELKCCELVCFLAQCLLPRSLFLYTPFSLSPSRWRHNGKLCRHAGQFILPHSRNCARICGQNKNKRRKLTLSRAIL